MNHQRKSNNTGAIPPYMKHKLESHYKQTGEMENLEAQQLSNSHGQKTDTFRVIGKRDGGVFVLNECNGNGQRDLYWVNKRDAMQAYFTENVSESITWETLEDMILGGYLDQTVDEVVLAYSETKLDDPFDTVVMRKASVVESNQVHMYLLQTDVSYLMKEQQMTKVALVSLCSVFVVLLGFAFYFKR